MSDKREYEIPGTGFYADRYNKHQVIYDCDGEVVAIVPAEWNEHELNIWAEAFTDGTKKGESWGKYSGGSEVQSAILGALGIDGRLREMESNIKLLASILYWHEGICKEDVAAMAGRD